jgi:hypothetical protein
MKKYSATLSNWAKAVFMLIAISTAGCTGYRVGSMLPPKYQTVAVPTFINESGEPFLQNPTTSAAISEFQIDGSLKIADIKTADTILTAKLTGFSLRPIRFSADRGRQANEYRMYINASITLTDRETGKVLVENPSIQGMADFIVSGDMSSSKKNALPEASKDLAHKIVEKIVEVW